MKYVISSDFSKIDIHFSVLLLLIRSYFLSNNFTQVSYFNNYKEYNTINRFFVINSSKDNKSIRIILTLFVTLLTLTSIKLKHYNALVVELITKTRIYLISRS